MLIFSAPLHCFRKTRAFRFLAASSLNVPRLYDLGFEHKVALRTITHASILLGRNKLEPMIRSLVIGICEELNQLGLSRCVLDVGANVGLYTWEISKICPNLKILSFEPDPNNFELLQMTHEASGSKNIELYSFALSDQSIEKDFRQDELTSATGSLSINDKPWIEQYLKGTSKNIKVQTRTLDQMLEEGKIPALVKIDVEGHENEVLEGGLQTIKISKPIIIIESFPPKQERVVKTLDDIGYQIYDADRLSSIQNGTCNLFAWHPHGPIKPSKIEKFLCL